MKSNLLFKVFVLVFLVLLAHIINLYFKLFRAFSWIDIPIHFAGGTVIGFALILILNHYWVKLKPIWEFLFVISFVALAAVLWELLEFVLVYILFHEPNGTYLGTLKDLVVGLLGGLFSAFISVNSEGMPEVK